VKLVSGWLGTKWEIWDFGWPVVGGYGGEGLAVVSGGWTRWWVVVGVENLDVREESDRGEGRGLYGWLGKMGERGGGGGEM
jgi:hypothetical protein